MKRIVGTGSIIVGIILAVGSIFLLWQMLPLGEIDIDESVGQQTILMIKTQWSNTAGFSFVGGLLLVAIGLHLRHDGGKQ